MPGSLPHLGAEVPPDETLESRHIKFHDEEGRDPEATLRGDGFVWELWVEMETKNAAVKKRFERFGGSAIAPFVTSTKRIAFLIT